MSSPYNPKYAIKIDIDGHTYVMCDVKKAASDIGLEVNKLPYSLRVLFENVIRTNQDPQSLLAFREWLKQKKSDAEVAFMPARVLMQDFTGVPAVVDLAAMRDAVKKLQKDPLTINPLIPVDLVIDHSVQVDYSGSADAFKKNVELEMQRNLERYEFLKWGQQTFDNFRVVPPGTGICHQVNLEYLAQVVWTQKYNNETLAYPDTVVGTDSHTTMVNGLSVLGWGVGGIEAEAAMLGRALPMILPEVVGVKLTGELRGNSTATDLVLTVTQMLRKKGVVGKFVEFFGPGLDALSLADRVTIANMAPEYGATCGFFPIDNETIKYLHLTARDPQQIKLVIEYAKANLLWRDANDDPEYTDVLALDLSTLETSLAGPKRPQDRVSLSNITSNFKTELPSLAKGDQDITKKYQVAGKDFSLGHGDVVIAAITSCTNTSNPSVMVAAGLLAKKACNLGLISKPWVKTSLAPGSQIVTEYLAAGGLDQYLNKLGFNLVGYGCTTCIGNSGPLAVEIDNTISNNQLVAASVLSGNRNFEGRVHASVRANYLASPPLVVAYAIAGSINLNLQTQALAKDRNGYDVYLKDLWPTQQEIKEYINQSLSSAIFKAKYSQVFTGDQYWQSLKIAKSSTYNWDKNSTYINHPPYFENIEKATLSLSNIKSARILAIFGDSITTDHISPAGNINKASPAAKYLMDHGVMQNDFNSYGARRGNHEVMMRGTFANGRIKNEMCPGIEGGVTINQLTQQQMSIYDAAMDYKLRSIPLVVIAGAEYGTGSSRDWAAKGTSLLGVKAVIAESFERIHRSNLAGMGVLPIVFANGLTRKDCKLTGSEEIEINGLKDSIEPYQRLQCVIKRQDGVQDTIEVILQVFTDSEIEYIRQGSVMHTVVYTR
ncbi:aconitate hydratase AcnA [Candidatus Trichorickettsia mobilis]|uniref:aconitate hydratase AcnA n=1 Tax=Candidatus Trichorickettsia mobilis TaxID=1346319 RepID=UPI00292D1CB8|nr:aconitate hydratase AcnA [Candidatus Trichorickettsia mobilis]